MTHSRNSYTTTCYCVTESELSASSDPHSSVACPKLPRNKAWLGPQIPHPNATKNSIPFTHPRTPIASPPGSLPYTSHSCRSMARGSPGFRRPTWAPPKRKLRRRWKPSRRRIRRSRRCSNRPSATPSFPRWTREVLSSSGRTERDSCLNNSRLWARRRCPRRAAADKRSPPNRFLDSGRPGPARGGGAPLSVTFFCARGLRGR